MTKLRTRYAKELRKQSTDTERLLWWHLRAKRMFGLKFRRQHPMGNYIVDFLCYEKLLIIELDGGQHAALSEKDRNRDSWLKDQGFRVLRFWNNDVLTNIEGVLQMILDACSGDEEV